MNSKIIIITILIFIKVIGIASRVRAENYIPGYTCDNSVIYTVNCPELRNNYFQYSYSFLKSTYRCGNTKVFKDV